MFDRFFKREHRDEAARALYAEIVKQSRRPVFYTDFGVADTVEGRFDLISLHAFLVFYRLKGAGEAAKTRSQQVFDVFFDDMDASLREMGVGDLAVPKRIKKMVSAFFGRIQAYDTALDGGDGAALAAAIGRNLLAGVGTEVEESALAGYTLRAVDWLKAIPERDLLAGEISFPDPEVREAPL